MQEQIKRFFWMLPVVVVIVCSALAAKAVNHYIEGEYLGDPKQAPKIDPLQGAKPTTKTNKRSKKGEPLVTRNMFCSECLPPEPEESETPSDTDQVPLTSLPLVLVATNVSANPTFSFATVRNTSSEKQGAYWVGEEIPEAGKVESIGGKNVIFRNEASKRSERITLLAKNPPKSAPKRATKPRRKPRNKREELLAEIDAGVKKVSDTSYEIDRAVVDKVLANPMAVARGARVVPSIKNGKNNGFKLYAIRPSSVYAKIGLRNGDTLHAVNGFDLTTADKALEVYQKVKESSNLTVTVTRRGKPVTLTYTIR
jgi:general secretion pathway protein C